MDKFERAALEHAAAELKYRRSGQAKIDLEVGKNQRRKADIAAGHSPKCTLSNCAPDCPSCK